jgi:hypothetical protein
MRCAIMPTIVAVSASGSIFFAFVPPAFGFACFARGVVFFCGAGAALALRSAGLTSVAGFVFAAALTDFAAAFFFPDATAAPIFLLGFAAAAAFAGFSASFATRFGARAAFAGAFAADFALSFMGNASVPAC